MGLCAITEEEYTGELGQVSTLLLSNDTQAHAAVSIFEHCQKHE